MRVVHKEWVNVQVNREVAERLLKIVKSDPEFKEVKEQLQEELSPSYEYKVQCGDCPRIYTVLRKTKLEKKEPIKNGLCVSCSDDYK